MQLDLLVDGGWQHLDLAARGRGSIGKAIYGADQSVRRLLVGGKARNGAFSVAPSRGAPKARASPSRRSANENFKTVTYAAEGFSGRSKAETSASWTN